jgi:NTE family protein
MERIATAFSVPEFAEWFLRGLKLSRRAGRTAAELWNVYGRLTFDELALPFAAVAHDIETGERIIFDKGPVATAVEASIRPPFFGRPTSRDGRYLLDGGIQAAVPTDVVREMGAKLAIGVGVGAFVRLPESLRPYAERLSQRLRRQPLNPRSISAQIACMSGLMARGRIVPAAADIEIRPNLRGISAYAPWNIELAILRGEQATRVALPSIRRLLAAKEPRERAGQSSRATA